MTDRELLELAAKAAGIKVATAHEHGLYLSDAKWWNPLEDDGDALQLAVKLRLKVFTPVAGGDCAIATVGDVRGAGYINHEIADCYAATRRAIVRAAAEIGRNME